MRELGVNETKKSEAVDTATARPPHKAISPPLGKFPAIAQLGKPDDKPLSRGDPRLATKMQITQLSVLVNCEKANLIVLTGPLTANHCQLFLVNSTFQLSTIYETLPDRLDLKSKPAFSLVDAG
jgi:hypothetical protein